MNFLEVMARSSRQRVVEARSQENEGALRRRALATPPPLQLRLHRSGFDVIAEVKLRSPSARGTSSRPDALSVGSRSAAYASAGACAISVLTEPQHFGGGLDHVALAAEAGIPVLRKDFLVDAYQVLESRAAGASGVLLIVRLLDERRTHEMLEVAREAELFVLLEAFDPEDVARARPFLDPLSDGPPILLGLNARDLSTLQIDRGRFRRCAESLLHLRAAPVAESGISTPEQIREIAALGYRAALIGSALMRSPDPRTLLSRFIHAGRDERAVRCRPE